MGIETILSDFVTNYWWLIILIVIIIFAGGLFLILSYFEKKRIEAMKAAASSRGFTFIENFDAFSYAGDSSSAKNIELTDLQNVKFSKDPSSQFNQSKSMNTFDVPGLSLFGVKIFTPWPLEKLPWLAFNIFALGKSKRIYNFMKKESSEGKIIAFDYSYVAHHQSGKNHSDTTYKQTVILAKLVKPVPKFELFPEGILGKLADIAGFKDIDFDSNKEFSNKYRLKGENEVGLRQAFTSPLLNYIVTNKPFGKIESNGQYLLFYNPSKMIKAEELMSKIDSATKITQLMSGH